MPDILFEFWRTLYFVISPYAANAFPPLVKGKHPIDFGKNFFDGHRILGDGKTWEGLFGGLAFGTFCGTIAWLFYDELNSIALTNNFSLPYISPFSAFILSLGALLGDLLGSFIKRRFGMQRGAPAPFLDQLDFLAGAFLLGSFVTEISLGIVIWAVPMTLIIHRISNIIGYLLKLKKEPW
ncbi:MAG TPA: CDP-2,3-bis-(O-geranylgeranyl)-sn-glycerol synthase [Nanoarchaeota archaeon]|nr:CDP-2,3-bis-(O-geranylgeranyl)-sn-glycerol synthase [Nanoarchaeota archaeon]